MMFYGLARSIGGIPHGFILEFVGALVGRYYFKKKFGKKWLKMIPVISAGYMVGAGLISMVGIGVVFLFKSSTTLPY